RPVPDGSLASKRTILPRGGRPRVGPRALAPSAAGERLPAVIREELARLTSWEERHQRLLARLTIVLITTALVDVMGSILVYHFERQAHSTQIKVFGDAVFFTTVQLLTVSSQIQNPFTVGGR